MKNVYSALAPFYDRLNGAADHEKYAEMIAGILEEHGITRGMSVIDAGCGTGQITVRLAKRGYDMIGVDISPEMLAEAQNFASRERVSLLLVCQDISNIDLYGSAPAAISTLDSLNYLTKPEQLNSFFSRIHNFVEPGGLLIFDLNAKYKFENIYGDNSYIIEEEGVYCGWENSYNKNTRLATFRLSIFEEERDGSYLRRNELQRERYYPDKTVIKMLGENGFALEKIYRDTEKNPAGAPDDLRHFFVCKRV